MTVPGSSVERHPVGGRDRAVALRQVVRCEAAARRSTARPELAGGAKRRRTGRTIPSQPSETTPRSMIAARSACDRACATFSSEPIASAATERMPEHDHAGGRAERSERAADEDDDEQLEREVRPVLRRVADPGELDAERARQARRGARHGERRRRAAAAPGCRSAAAAASRSRAAARPRPSGERASAAKPSAGEGRQRERELVVPGRRRPGGDDEPLGPAEEPAERLRARPRRATRRSTSRPRCRLAAAARTATPDQRRRGRTRRRRRAAPRRSSARRPGAAAPTRRRRRRRTHPARATAGRRRRRRTRARSRRPRGRGRRRGRRVASRRRRAERTPRRRTPRRRRTRAGATRAARRAPRRRTPRASLTRPPRQCAARAARAAQARARTGSTSRYAGPSSALPTCADVTVAWTRPSAMPADERAARLEPHDHRREQAVEAVPRRGVDVERGRRCGEDRREPGPRAGERERDPDEPRHRQADDDARRRSPARSPRARGRSACA